MRKHLAVTFLMACLSSTTWAVNAQSNLSQQAGYSVGYIMTQNNPDAIKSLDLNQFVSAFSQGLAAAANKEKPALTEEQMNNAITQYKQLSETKELIVLKQEAINNLNQQKQFLIQNAKKSDVVILPSGLQYEVLSAGNGARPNIQSKVTINYEGRLANGTVFDSSVARQQSVTVSVSDLITGLAEGLKTMKEGSKVRFYVPSKLGYGEIGTGDTVQPNSLLIFDVELLKVQ